MTRIKLALIAAALGALALLNAGYPWGPGPS